MDYTTARKAIGTGCAVTSGLDRTMATPHSSGGCLPALTPSAGSRDTAHHSSQTRPVTRPAKAAVTFSTMEPTAITLVSQLITDARTRFGAHDVEALAVNGDLLDQTMDHVLSTGGHVSMDSCVVDGVEVRELPSGQEFPLAYIKGEAEPRPLTG